MPAYLAACWTGAEPEAVGLLRDRLRGDPDWRAAADEAGLLLAVRGPVCPRVRHLPAGRGWVIGDIFRRSFGGALGDSVDHLMIPLGAPSRAVAAELRDAAWGRYVALIDPGRPTSAVFRDPSGAADALLWRAGPLRLVASHLPDWLPDWAWPDLDFDWAAIARWLQTESAGAVMSGLRGATSVTPGALATWAGGERQVWRPADHAAPGATPPAEPGVDLPELLDNCMAALAGEAGGLLAEVSGGLDSAIVASSLARVGGGKVRQWLNYHAADGSGDELAYARQVATLCGFELTEAVKSDFVFDAPSVEAAAGGFRPGFHALDSARDRDLSALIRSLGVDRVVTGQGGDMVFFNMPTPVIAADQIRGHGLLRRPTAAYLAGVARWTRQSVWRVAAQALDPRAAWPGTATVASHGWMQGAGALPPGKRCHIAMIAQKLTVNIENLRGRWAEVVNPLMCQPIMEACLAIPVPDLTRGGRDRGLARALFSGRIPDAVRDRRGKGEFSTYYGRAVADGLGFLRPYLLEGRLAAAGLLDLARFDGLLSAEALIWRAETAPIMTALMVEAWLRTWAACAARRGPAAGPWSSPATPG